MMEEVSQPAVDQEGYVVTVIPVPTFHSGQNIQDYLNQNQLTIVEIGKVETLRKELVVAVSQLEEFKKKEQQWEARRKELEDKVNSEKRQKEFIISNHGKMLGCLRKVAEVTQFRSLKQSSSKTDSKCDFELVRADLLNKFTDHAVKTFKELEEMKKNVPVECEPSTLPAEPKKKKAKKTGDDFDVPFPSDEKESQVAPIKTVVEAINRKLRSATLPLPLPPASAILPQPNRRSSRDSYASPSTSPRPQGSASSKWRCDQCGNRLNSNRELKEHQCAIDGILGWTRPHNQPMPVKVFGKPRKCAAEKEVHLSSKIPESKTPGLAAGSGNCRCFVCGETFGNMAALNFHVKKKHNV